MIIDLRDYTTNPGMRDALIERCESLFFPEQERLGATIVGLFRDADDENRYVWLRAAPDLAARQRILTAFYSDGEMWQAHRDEVNTWIADSDNVLLVRPVSETAEPATGVSIVAMYSLIGHEPLDDAAARGREVENAIAVVGGRLLVTLATDSSENNYPRHAIRVGDHGLVWFATFAPEHDCAIGVASLATRRLRPAATSRLR